MKAQSSPSCVFSQPSSARNANTLSANGTCEADGGAARRRSTAASAHRASTDLRRERELAPNCAAGGTSHCSGGGERIVVDVRSARPENDCTNACAIVPFSGMPHRWPARTFDE